MLKRIRSFDGIEISYDIEKKKSNTFLVFIHGVGGSSTAWKRVRDFFHKKGISTMTIDLRGHGLSEKPKHIKDYRLDNFAKDIKQVLLKEKIKDFIMISHSFGSVVATVFQKLYPNLPKSYILVSPMQKAPKKAGMFHKNPLLWYETHILEHWNLRIRKPKPINYDKFFGTTDWSPRRLYSDISNTSLKSWLFTYRYFSEFDGTETIKAIKKPILILHGEIDKFVDVSESIRLHQTLKGSELDIIKGGNHIIPINNYDEVAHDIFKFIKKKDLI